MDMFTSFWRSRYLIWQMTKRDIMKRYRGSVMGILWSFINPLLMLAVYTLVFSVVFESRWEGGQESKANFSLILFSGMIVFDIFSEVVNNAPKLVLSNVNYVKKIVFPLEILVWINLGSKLFHAVISVMVLQLFQIFIAGVVHWTVIFFPFVLLPLILITVGFAWFLASIGVYMRDVGQVISFFTTVLLFTSAVFYPASALPSGVQFWSKINPLVSIIEESRKVLIYGQLPDWKLLVALLIVGFFIAEFGFIWFQKTRKGFADVL